MFYGQGAGKLATASAVVADVIDCAQHDKQRKIFGWGPAKENLLADPMEAPTRFFVRAKTADRAADEARLAAAIPGCVLAESDADDFVFVTPEDREGVLRAAIASLSLKDASVIHMF